MTNQASTSQLKPVFSFPLHDRQSRERFLIGSGLLLSSFIVPIIPGLIVFGYILRIMRSTAKGEAPTMAAWSDWSSLLNLGFRGTIVNSLFTLPSFVFFLFGIVAYFGAFFLIPLSSSAETDAGGALLSAVFLAMAVMFMSLALGTLLLMLGLIPLPASLAHFVVKDELSAAFRLREWWPILSSNRLGYFISFVIVMGILGIMYFVVVVMYYTFVLMCLAYFIMIPLSFYALLVGAALFGDTYREGLASLQQDAEANVISA